ncbi:uncharacterized protein [Manis javanica]|uniref:uncharacterized protein isoform X1 n=1 Tax=Manis javanica TaxID=9974 RepID=UPI003C6CE960
MPTTTRQEEPQHHFGRLVRDNIAASRTPMPTTTSLYYRITNPSPKMMILIEPGTRHRHCRPRAHLRTARHQYKKTSSPLVSRKQLLETDLHPFPNPLPLIKQKREECLPESRRWACALSLQCPLAVCLATHVLDKCVRTEQQERTKQRTLSWLRRSPQSRPVPTSGLPTSNSKINAHRGARQDVASRLLTPRLPAPAALPGAGQERNCRSQSPAHAVTSPGRLEGHPQRAALARFTGR